MQVFVWGDLSTNGRWGSEKKWGVASNKLPPSLRNYIIQCTRQHTDIIIIGLFLKNFTKKCVTEHRQL